MGSHPVNLIFRFLLELAVLALAGFWAYQLFSGLWGVVFAVCLLLVLALIWGVFNVPNDPSRSGKAPVVVSGKLRLFIELVFFAIGVCILFQLQQAKLALLFAALVLLHYGLSYDRLQWLWRV